MSAAPSNSDLIAEGLGHGPDVEICAPERGWHLARWRHFLGNHSLPALPDPMLVIHVGGSRHLRAREAERWTQAASMPGLATIVPAGRPSSWLIDGELDVVTLSVASGEFRNAPGRHQFEQIRFGFFDALGLALTRQILAGLYPPQGEEQRGYLIALVEALKAHVLHGPVGAAAQTFPVSSHAAFRIHRVIEQISLHPENEFSLTAMAREAGLTPTHFCRVFKRATGLSPHRYVQQARLERAQAMLAATEMPVAAVAQALGFVSQSHFGRLFRDLTGQTPSAWRRTRIKLGGKEVTGP
ncbi:MAG: helix-turn-helix domain-containing protein [Pseudomonadota bacterium]